VNNMLSSNDYPVLIFSNKMTAYEMQIYASNPSSHRITVIP